MRLNTEKPEYCVIVDDSKFYGYPLTPQESQDLLNKSVVKEWEKGQRFKEPNMMKYKLAKVRKVITRWENIQDKNGNPLECNDVNKELVYLFNPKTIDSVLARFDEIAAKEQKEAEHLEKNSEAGQDGSEDQEQ